MQPVVALVAPVVALSEQIFFAGNRYVVPPGDGRVFRRKILGLGLCRLDTFLADFLAENRRVIPTETQFGIGRKTSKRSERFGTVGFGIEKNIAFGTLDQGKHVGILAHDLSLPIAWWGLTLRHLKPTRLKSSFAVHWQTAIPSCQLVLLEMCRHKHSSNFDEMR
jgi:hypothetical protein